MELTKYHSSEILAHIRHDLRQIPAGKSYGNQSVDLALTKENYSLINRGKTAKEVNQYRKDFEAKLFKYNRSNLVHAVELVIQCPSDCPPEEHAAFFQTAFEWYCNTYLPAGKECVFLCEVHKDEHHWISTDNGMQDISKEHMHLAYVPAIPAGEKKPEFTYRLNADALTKKSILRSMHSSLQSALDKAGIHATVCAKKTSDGKTIPLTVKQLKELTAKTGMVLDHSLTLDELGSLLQKTHDLEKATSTISAQQQDLSFLRKIVSEKDLQIQHLQHNINESASNTKEKIELQQSVFQKELQLSAAQKTISSYELQLSNMTSENQKLQLQIHALETDAAHAGERLKQLQLKVSELEKQTSIQSEHTWGTNSWENSPNGWGNPTSKDHTIEEEKLW